MTDPRLHFPHGVTAKQARRLADIADALVAGGLDVVALQDASLWELVPSCEACGCQLEGGHCYDPRTIPSSPCGTATEAGGESMTLKSRLPVGECCGRHFYTWEGYQWHLYWKHELDSALAGLDDEGTAQEASAGVGKVCTTSPPGEER